MELLAIMQTWSVAYPKAEGQVSHDQQTEYQQRDKEGLLVGVGLCLASWVVA